MGMNYVIPEQELGPRIERSGYQHVPGSGYGAGALWVPGTWSTDSKGNRTFQADRNPDNGGKPYAPESQEQIAKKLFPESSPYLSGNRAKPASGKAPDVQYMPDGRAFYWDLSYGSPVRQFLPDQDDPTKASGYRAPSIRTPSYQITPDPSTGRLVAIDPANPTNRIDLGAFGFKDYSPQEKRSFQVEDVAGERAARREETAADRGFRREESNLDRAIRAGEFAATYNAGEAARRADIEARNQQMAFNVEQDYQNRLRAFASDQTGRARQFAELISATDPGALPAFLAAGGGNIGNALASGATAQTDTANLGAAKTLRVQRETPAPTRFSISPIAYQPGAFTGITIPGAAAAPATAAPVDKTPGFTVNPNGGIDLSAKEIQAGATYQGVPGYAEGTHMGYAEGTDFIPAPPAFKVGDSPTGMPTGREEMVEVADPEGNAHVRVTPDSMVMPDERPGMAGGMDSMDGAGKFRLFGDVLKAVGAYLSDEAMPQTPEMPEMPRFALGTYTGTMADELVSPGDDPYLGEVRNIRNAVQYPDLNPYSTGFANQLPTMQQRFYAGRQTRYGVPVQDQAAEEQRYRLQGANRGAFSLGV